MKTTLLVLCLLFATAAFAQYGGVPGTMNSQAQSYSFPYHPAHASYVPLSQEQTVLASASYTSAQGERPASDFPQAEAIPLGTLARGYRKEHAHFKKSRVVWVNQ